MLKSLPTDAIYRVVSERPVWVRHGKLAILEFVGRNEAGVWGWLVEPYTTQWELYHVHPGGIVLPLRQWVRLDGWCAGFCKDTPFFSLEKVGC